MWALESPTGHPKQPSKMDESNPDYARIFEKYGLAACHNDKETKSLRALFLWRTEQAIGGKSSPATLSGRWGSACKLWRIAHKRGDREFPKLEDLQRVHVWGSIEFLDEQLRAGANPNTLNADAAGLLLCCQAFAPAAKATYVKLQLVPWRDAITKCDKDARMACKDRKRAEAEARGDDDPEVAERERQQAMYHALVATAKRAVAEFHRAPSGATFDKAHFAACRFIDPELPPWRQEDLAMRLLCREPGEAPGHFEPRAPQLAAELDARGENYALLTRAGLVYKLNRYKTLRLYGPQKFELPISHPLAELLEASLFVDTPTLRGRTTLYSTGCPEPRVLYAGISPDPTRPFDKNTVRRVFACGYSLHHPEDLGIARRMLHSERTHSAYQDGLGAWDSDEEDAQVPKRARLNEPSPA